jgi:hypothetical protein
MKVDAYCERVIELLDRYKDDRGNLISALSCFGGECWNEGLQEGTEICKKVYRDLLMDGKSKKGARNG